MTFGSVGGPLYLPGIAFVIRNSLQSAQFREDTRGQKEPLGDTIRSHLVPTPVPTEAWVGPAPAPTRAIFCCRSAQTTGGRAIAGFVVCRVLQVQ